MSKEDFRNSLKYTENQPNNRKPKINRKKQIRRVAALATAMTLTGAAITTQISNFIGQFDDMKNLSDVTSQEQMQQLGLNDDMINRIDDLKIRIQNSEGTSQEEIIELSTEISKLSKDIVKLKVAEYKEVEPENVTIDYIGDRYTNEIIKVEKKESYGYDSYVNSTEGLNQIPSDIVDLLHPFEGIALSLHDTSGEEILERFSKNMNNIENMAVKNIDINILGQISTIGFDKEVEASEKKAVELSDKDSGSER